MLPQTVQPEELVWVITGLLALYLSIRNLKDSLIDRAEARSRGVNGDVRILTNGDVRNDRFFMWGQVLLLSVGVVAMTRGPAPESNALSRAYIVAVFLGIQFGFVMMSFMNLRDRKILLSKEPTNWDGTERREV